MVRTVRLLFWNTFLLEVLPIDTPFGRRAVHRKPAVAARSGEIGRAVAGRYDVVALAEAFDSAEQERIAEAWAGAAGSPTPRTAVGPDRADGPLAKSSGLFTLSVLPVRRVERHTFENRGSRRHDADAHAAKGVLLVEIDPGADGRSIEVYSTHLAFGGDLLPRGRGTQAAAVRALRQAQAEELAAFVARTHSPGAVPLVCGDFNISARDPGEADPDGPYEALVATMATAGVTDLWAAAGGGYGYTCDLLKRGRGICPFDPADPDFAFESAECPDDFGTDRLGQRIDYWFGPPKHSWDEVGVVDFRIRRRAFPRVPGAESFDELGFMSDHVALHLEVTLR